MDDVNQTNPQPEVADLQEQVASLRKLLSLLLILTVVASATFNIYLWRQVRYTRADLAGTRLNAGPMINDYQQNTGPKFDAFIKALQDYSKTHPDFGDIAKRYGLNQPPPAAAKK